MTHICIARIEFYDMQIIFRVSRVRVDLLRKQYNYTDFNCNGRILVIEA